MVEDIFVKKGFEGSSISDIASQAKTNKSLIYHYFENKDDLVKLCLCDLCIPGLKDTCIIPLQGVKTTSDLKGSLMAFCNEDDPNSFAIL